ncbi:formylmethanofuran dehydrogenase subunit A [Methanophagales archaeon]|nr:formylmethanofuran dehydrogenase subunit A [Methanophagales archaeon]
MKDNAKCKVQQMAIIIESFKIEMAIQISNGTVYDPKNGLEGEKMDIFVCGGKIVDEIKPDEIIDATGKTVMAGGIDVHSHVATYGLNLARFTFGFPTVGEIGHTYAKMGYTHVNEPLMTLNTASYVHHELSSIPLVDTSALLVLSLYDIDKEIREGAKASVKSALPLLLDLTKAIGIKIYDIRVKYAKKGFFYRGIDVTKCLKFFRDMYKEPKILLRAYPELLDEDTDLLRGFCMAHIGSGIDNDTRYEAAIAILKKGGAVDLGIVSPYPDEAVNMQIGYAAASETFMSMDIGLEQPLIFSAVNDKREGYIKSLRFALDALECLQSSNISFSTDSPSGCLFSSYPKLFAWLLSRRNRKELRSDTEYSIYELAKITRTNPARQLGLENKGHLGIGADADIAIYDMAENTDGRALEKRLGNCSFLLKGGEVIIREGKLNRARAKKKTFYFVPEVKRGPYKSELMEGICNRRSFRAEHLSVDECFLGCEGVW